MGVLVRAECPSCGHTLETETEGRRTTWRGPCPNVVDGRACGTRLIARRVPLEQPPANGPETEPPATTIKGGVRVREVKEYIDGPATGAGFEEPIPDDSTAEHGPGELVDDTGELAGQLAEDVAGGTGSRDPGLGGPAAEDEAGADGSAGSGENDDQPAGSRRRRGWRHRRADDVEPAGDAAGWVVPGIY